MSEKNSDGSYTHTPSANQLDVFDPNMDLPAEPPPSYDEAMADPSIPDEDTPPEAPQRPPQTPSRTSSVSTGSSANYARPSAPPPSRISAPTTTTQTSTYPATSSSSQYSRPNAAPPSRVNQDTKYSRPSAAPPSKTSQATTYTSTHTATGTGSGSSSGSSKPALAKPTPINPNPYLPWKYPSSYRCSKCENTGYKKKNGHPCKTCWGRFRPQTTPPATITELENLVKHKPKPKPINSNVVKLPPGATVMPRYSNTPAPLVVQPGDPRIGGVICPRCNGRGMVHFFLDLERCTNCNGLGRVSFNGRPL